MGFWIDEALTVFHVSDISRNIFLLSNPPLFHYLAKPFYLVFGRDDFWLRFPAAVFGAVAVPVLYLILRRLLDARAGLLGAFLLAISPFHIWFSQEFRMYTLAALLNLLLIDRWIRARETDASRAWIFYAAVAVAGLYTHYWFLFIVAAQLTWLAFEYGCGRRYADRNLLILLLIPLSFVLWVPGVIRQVYEDEFSFLVKPGWGDFLRVFQAYAFGLGHPFGFWAKPSISGLEKIPLILIPAALPVLGVFWPGRERRKFVEIFLAGFAVPLVAIFLISVFAAPLFVPSRYTMLFFPVYVLCVARLTEVRRWWVRRPFLAVAAAWVLVAGVSLRHYYFKFDKASGKMLRNYAAEQAGHLKLCTEFLNTMDLFSVNYYQKDDLSRLGEVDRIPGEKELTSAPYDLLVPVPFEREEEMIARLPRGWEIRARRALGDFIMFRLSKTDDVDR